MVATPAATANTAAGDALVMAASTAVCIHALFAVDEVTKYTQLTTSYIIAQVVCIIS